MLHKFNAYCYDKRHVVLLADNCPAHKPPLGATPWHHGNLQGYKMSNVLLIYFEPNCTSHVQPLDEDNCPSICRLSCGLFLFVCVMGYVVVDVVGCIQTAKAFYRKRQMSRELQELARCPPGQKPVLKCNIRQAIEWFLSSLHAIPSGWLLVYFVLVLKHLYLLQTLNPKLK